MALVAISALPASTTIITTDVLPFVRGGTTDKITAGNLRAQLFAFAATDPLNCGILTAVGNSTITGTLSGVTNMSASSYATGILTPSAGNYLAANTKGYLVQNSVGSSKIAMQLDAANVWQVGDSLSLNILGGMTVASGITLTSGTTTLLAVTATSIAMAGALSGVTSITLTAAASKIIPGATSLSLRNTADSADNLILTDAGAATFRSTVGGITTLTCTTVTATNLGGTLSTAAQASVTSLGTLTSLTTSGAITITAAASQIVPGATSFAVRNNANNANNLLIADSGLQTWRGNVQMANTTGIFLGIGIGSGIFSSAGTNQLIGENRITGFTNGWTGAAADKATAYDASTITLPQLAARVRAIQEALTAATSGHGLIGA